MVAYRSIADVEADIRGWIQQSSQTFRDKFQDSQGKVWVLKYFSPRFLDTFISDSRLAISAIPGFTWGDGIYVVPLEHPYSTMMYGRVGVMGWINDDDVRFIYDASEPRGRELYREWITGQVFLYDKLTTTIHADIANRYLRNRFRRRFDINLVQFSPDQYNRAYVAPGDRWFCLSDWSGTGLQAPGQRPALSSKVKECEWVAVVGEEFEKSSFQVTYRDLIGPRTTPPGVLRVPSKRHNLTPNLWKCYQDNRARKMGQTPYLVYVGL